METLCRRETSCIASCAILNARAAQGGAYRNRVLKALGNSVAIPCVDFIVNGMATALRNTINMERKELAVS